MVQNNRNEQEKKLVQQMCIRDRLSFLPFSGGGMVSDAVFLRLCRTVRVHGTGDPDGICCGCGWTEEGMESGGCDYLPERKYGGDTPDRGKERGRILY